MIRTTFVADWFSNKTIRIGLFYSWKGEPFKSIPRGDSIKLRPLFLARDLAQNCEMAEK